LAFIHVHPRPKKEMKISIVGPCAAGKTTLARNLKARGYDAEECTQEHSHVQAMWQRIAHPDVLIYLDASLPTIRARLSVDWEQSYLDEINRRLTHARAHAHFSLDTNPLTPEELCDRVEAFLRSFPDAPQVFEANVFPTRGG
jgi:adenylate kinase family enzyme